MGIIEPQGGSQEADQVANKRDEVVVDEKHDGVHHVDVAHSKVLADSDLMNDAFDGENEEHEQSLWAAVKSHPKACFWAFVMCFTIVSVSQSLESADSGLYGTTKNNT